MGEKMYAILHILMTTNHQYMTASEIIEELKTYHISIERKHVYTIIEQINLFFYPIFHDDLIKSIKKRGNYLSKDYFDDGELQFLLDNITYHEDLNDEDKLKLKNKLYYLSSSHQQHRLINNETTSKLQTFSLLINLTTIMKAIEKQMALSFQYINYEIKEHHLIETPSTHGNNLSQYTLSPYQIVSSYNHYYVIGYNEIHQNRLSIYRIDRMRYVQTMKNIFIDITEQFDVTTEIMKMTNMYTSNKHDTLQLECDKSVLREIVSHFGEDIYIEETHDGQCLAIIEDVPISDGLIGYLMMLQNQVKVVAPITLKNEFIKRLQSMIKQYED